MRLAVQLFSICFFIVTKAGVLAQYQYEDKYGQGKWPFKFYGTCRSEDFMHWSEERNLCTWTRRLYAVDAENSGLKSCNDDEFRCPTPFRCIPRYYLNTDNDCYFSNLVTTTLPCRSNEFTCAKTRRCIPRWTVYNKVDDCDDREMPDNSDETSGPYEKCESDELRCNQTGRCIPREWVMDGENDCPRETNSVIDDNSDEVIPLATCYENTEFKCTDNGRCLKRYRVMDGFDDCRDESDERRPLPICTREEFRCADNGRCIPRAWRGDGRENCKDGSDEQFPAEYSCTEKEFRCHNRKRCINKIYQCDGMDHCGDCSDEIEGCKEPAMWRCPTDNATCIPQSFACTAFQNCPGHADKMSFLPGFKCKSIASEFFEITCAIPQWMLHDELSVCSDKSDLCFNGGNFTCAYCADNKTIISQKQICDGVLDCTDMWDECLCPTNPNGRGVEALCENVFFANKQAAGKPCEAGKIYCKEEGKCLEQRQLCDGVIDCPLSKMDEEFCIKPTTEFRNEVSEHDMNCSKLNLFIVLYLKKEGIYPLLKPIIRESANRCDGVLECHLFEDECNSDCPNRMEACDRIPLQEIELDTHIRGLSFPVKLRTCANLDPTELRENIGFLTGISICDGIQQCDDGTDELNCTGRHYCDAGQVQFVTKRKVVSIRHDKLCDGVSNCMDESDEKGCNTTTHFYCYNQKPLYVSFDKVMDGKQDCEDNSDECPIEAYDDNAISSREEMIRNPFLRYFIWIMTFLAIVGNIGVVLETCLLDASSKSTSMGKCNRIMILNLATSDFIMGIALLIIGIKSSLLSGNYCQQDEDWRTSGLCSMIGVLVVMSSETSVFTLMLLTLYRLYGVLNPFASRNIKLRPVFIYLGACWFVSIMLAIIPVIPGVNHNMISQARTTPSRYFPTTRVTWEEMHRFAVRTIILGNVTEVSPEDLSSWRAIEDLRDNKLMRQYAPKILGYFGYYSANGVCIPRLFRQQNDPPLHWLSLFVVTFNFCGLVFIILSYIKIYSVASRKPGNIRSSDAKEKKSKAMQRKITILIATDLCCWLPICIMSFLSQAGVSVPGIAYAVAATLLLPINSSINPLVYSNGFEATRHHLSEKFKE